MNSSAEDSDYTSQLNCREPSKYGDQYGNVHNNELEDVKWSKDGLKASEIEVLD